MRDGISNCRQVIKAVPQLLCQEDFKPDGVIRAEPSDEFRQRLGVQIWRMGKEGLRELESGTPRLFI
jgi:hypothetical protein